MGLNPSYASNAACVRQSPECEFKLKSGANLNAT